MRPLLTLLVVVAMLLVPTAPWAQPFEDATVELGVELPKLPYDISSMNAGVSYVDVDGDGYRDIFYTGPHRPGALWRGGPSGFEYVAEALGPVENAMGHTFFDMDGDGDLDLLVATEGPNRLYANTPTGFVDVTASRLPGIETWTLSAAAGDYDGDGDTDLYVANYVHANAFPEHLCARNSLLENDGHGFFRAVEGELGVAGQGCTFVTSMADVDDDGDLDLLAVNDFGQFTDPNELYINQGPGPDGRPIYDVAPASDGFAQRHYGMGLALGDLDDDGALDAAMTNIGEALLLRRGDDGVWSDESGFRGLDAVKYAYEAYQVTWAATFHDVDADGWLDLALVGGYLVAASFIKNLESQPQVLLRGGDPSGVLREVAPADRYGADDQPARDIEFADVNEDGRDDVLLAHNDGTVGVFLNRRTTGGRPTMVRLRATETSGGAAGARITASCAGFTRRVSVNVGRMYGVADVGDVTLTMPPPCIGVGQPLALRVRWPSGVETDHQTETGGDVTLTEPDWLRGELGGPASLEVDLSETITTAASVALQLPSGDRLPLTQVDTDRFELVTVPDVSWSQLVVDGTVLPRVLRRVVAPPERWSYPAHVVAGAETTWTVAPLAAGGAPLGPNHGVFIEVAGKVQPTVDLGNGSYQATSVVPPAGSDTLDLATWVDGTRREVASIPLATPYDWRWSRVGFTRLFNVGALVPETETARVRIYSSDPNGRLRLPSLDEVTLGVDGATLMPTERVERTRNARFHFPMPLVTDGAKARPHLNGVPILGAADRAQRFASASEAFARVSATESRCMLSEHRVVADGVDQITAIIFVESAGGTGIPLDDVEVSFRDDGLRVVPDSIDSATGVVEATLTADPAASSRASARLLLDGVDVGVACSVAVAQPRPTPRVDATKSEIRLRYEGFAPLGTPLVVHIVPRGSNGRAVGSSASPHISVEHGELLEPVSYFGHGRFKATIAATDATAAPIVTARHQGVANVSYSVELTSVLTPATGPRGHVGLELKPLETRPDIAQTRNHVLSRAAATAPHVRELGPESVAAEDTATRSDGACSSATPGSPAYIIAALGVLVLVRRRTTGAWKKHIEKPLLR